MSGDPTPVTPALLRDWALPQPGDRLATRVGPLGYLARELADEVPGPLVRFGAGRPALDD